MSKDRKIALAVGTLAAAVLLWSLLPPIQLYSDRDVATLNTKNLVTIYHAIALYQNAHGGIRPDRLEDALPEDMRRDVQFRADIGAEGMPWQYFSNGSNGLIVVSPQATGDRILALREDGEVLSLPPSR